MGDITHTWWDLNQTRAVLMVSTKPRANLRLTGRHGKWGQCLRHKTQEDLKEATAPTIGKRCVHERTELIEAPSSSILAEQTHWARVVACQSSVCGAGGTTNKFRSSVGGSYGQVEYSRRREANRRGGTVWSHFRDLREPSRHIEEEFMLLKPQKPPLAFVSDQLIQFLT